MEITKLSSLILPLTILITLTSFVLSQHNGLPTLDIVSEISTDPDDTSLFATDFGNLSKSTPGAVFYPSSPNDIATLIRFSYWSPKPFPISQRGAGHSTQGQTFVPDGVLVYMPSLGRNKSDSRITVTNGPIPYVDAGGEQLWINVLNATLKHGLMPRVFTDYLYPTVGGTLSNAGISGAAFKHGPQISNVYELDVITGTGETITCSREMEPDLFYGALGGLGQFGVITRARIALEPAQKTARRVLLFYTDVELLMKDQEKLISIENDLSGFDFVGGQVLLNKAQVSRMRSSLSDSDLEKITRLFNETDGPVYLIDAAVYFNDTTAASVDQNIKVLLKELHYISGYAFSFDMPLLNFLNRLYYLEVQLTPLGQWLVPHPWLDLFVPKSKVLEFDSRIFKGILKGNNATGALLLFPMNRAKWDDKMSAVTPDEEIFYVVSLLWTALENNAQTLTDANDQVVRICEEYSLGCKEYLPHFTNQQDWERQFGNKWGKFVSRKKKYDPKVLLSPGQQIFTPLEKTLNYGCNSTSIVIDFGTE
ncbi:cytokinin dehydrogenase 6-like protein [Carex littledalei]|uniref:cytokinin dehydrogenase n=1 Tax=Carex littledalei TaxID=544730 RepID=A0A833RD19_9POAL|nr:cytokinin dehydrogenase 6-like protein [Carex littledalei]